MKTNNDHMPNKTADFVIDRDVFGQVKNMRVSVFKKFKYKPINAPELNVTYANLGARSIATLLDLIIAVSILIVAETFLYSSSLFNMEINMFRVLGGIFIWILYNSVLESSVFQATIGELTLNLKVIDLFGKKLSFLRALTRCIATIVSILPFGYGIWYITTDPKKQSWHDLIAGTFVVKK
jgi:uncharacterized RDD family membrane protein YckC